MAITVSSNPVTFGFYPCREGRIRAFCLTAHPTAYLLCRLPGYLPGYLPSRSAALSSAARITATDGLRTLDALATAHTSRA